MDVQGFTDFIDTLGFDFENIQIEKLDRVDDHQSFDGSEYTITIKVSEKQDGDFDDVCPACLVEQTMGNTHNTRNISYAIDMLKDGYAVSRADWSEGYWLEIIPVETGNGSFPMISLHRPDDEYQVWTPQQTDLLFEDWYLTEEIQGE